MNRMGFNVGEPDGRLGPRTKEALMAFQHQKGFNATGEIDRETFAALRSEGGQQGNEGKAVEGERGNQPATTGQGGAKRVQRATRRRCARQCRPALHHGSEQSRGRCKQPPERQHVRFISGAAEQSAKVMSSTKIDGSSPV